MAPYAHIYKYPSLFVEVKILINLKQWKFNFRLKLGYKAVFPRYPRFFKSAKIANILSLDEYQEREYQGKDGKIEK